MKALILIALLNISFSAIANERTNAPGARTETAVEKFKAAMAERKAKAEGLAFLAIANERTNAPGARTENAVEKFKAAMAKRKSKSKQESK